MLTKLSGSFEQHMLRNKHSSAQHSEIIIMINKGVIIIIIIIIIIEFQFLWPEILRSYILLIPQSFDCLAAFHLDLLQAILFIAG